MTKVEIDSEVQDAPLDFTGNSPQYWIDRILFDLFFLCTRVLSYGKLVEYQDLNWVHKGLCDFLDPRKNPILQQLVLMGRDMLKSSIGRAMMIQWFLQQAYFRTQEKAFIYSGVFELAQDHLEKIIREILRNEIIQAYFYKYIPQKKDEFDICRLDEGKIRYKGIEIDIGSPDKTLTGHHYQLGMIDNLCNEINTQTVEMRKKTNKRWQQIESIFAENAREVIFETPWANDDVSGIILHPEGKFDYKQLWRKPCQRFISDTGYAVFSCPAAQGDGEIGDPVFPEKLNLEYLERKRRKQGPYIYSCLYDLVPIPDEEIIIRPGWNVRYEQLPKSFIRNICVDAAGTTKKRSSHSGLSVGEWDEAGTLYLPFAGKRKLSPMELEDWILLWVDTSRDEGRPVTWVGIEREKFGIYLKDSLEAKRKDLIIILWDNQGKSRPRRHGDIIPFYEARKILSGPGLDDYDDEIKTYYKGKETNVDIIDTIWGHFQIRLLPQKMKFQTPQDEVRGQLEKEIEAFERQAKQDMSGQVRLHRSIVSKF